MKLALLLFLLPMLASAQNERWSIMPGRDSLVAAPLKHLRIALSYRETVDSMNVNYRLEIHERVGAAISWNLALSKSDSIATVRGEQLALCAVGLDNAMTDRDKYQKQAIRRNTWAWIGRGAVVAVGIAGVVTLITVLK